MAAELSVGTSFYRRYGKRTFDLLVASGAMVVLSPLLLIVGGVVALRLGRPVLFLQRRTGYHRQPFNVLKFRSMLDATDEYGRALPDEERLIAFGAWLRSTSIDELPALLNILCGEMSFIGPRPLVHVYEPLYSPAQARRFAVRPGLTGWAQVNGRNMLSWPEKFALDAWYVDHYDVMIDIRILWATVRKVVGRKGINDANGAPVIAFAGETNLPPDFDPARPTGADRKAPHGCARANN